MQNLLNDIRALKWLSIAKIVAGSCILILALLAVGLIYLNSSNGRTQLTSLINDNLDSDENSITISKIEGSLFSDLSIDKITISDPKGIWLEIKNIHVKWSAMALLNGLADLSMVEVDNLTLYRQPITTEKVGSEAENTFSVPELPLDINIATYRISVINIDQDFANIPTRLKSDGTVKLTNEDGILAQINLISTEQYNDNLVVDFVYPKDGSNLNIDVNLQAPRNGLFVNLLGIEARHDLALEIKGQGPINNWAGTFNVHADENNIIDADIKRSEKSFSLTANMDASEFISEDLNNIIGSTSRLNINLTPSEQNNQPNLSLELSTAIASLKAEGNIDTDQSRADDKIDFTFKLSNTEPINDFISPNYLRPFEISGTLKNLNTVPNIILVVDKVMVGHDEMINTLVTGQVNLFLEQDYVRFNTKGKLDELNGTSVSSITPLIKNGVNWSVDGTINKDASLITIQSLLLENEFININGNSSFSNKNSALSANIITSAKSLSAISQAMNLETVLKGTADLNIVLNQDNAQGPLKTNIDAHASSLDSGQNIVNALLGPSPSFKSIIEIKPDGAISIKEATLQSAHITSTGNFDISKDQIFNKANFQIAINNLVNIDEMQNLELTGGINIDGILTGSIASPSITVNTKLEQLNIQNINLENFTAKLEAIDSIENPSGHLTLNSESNLGPLSATSDFIKENNIYKIKALKVDLGSYNAYGDFEVEQEKPVTGLLTILTDQNENPESGISGDVTALVKLSNDNNSQHININSTMTELAFPIGENEVLTLKDGKVLADILITEDMPEITVNSEINELMHPYFQAKSARIAVDQNENNIIYNIDLEGTQTMPYAMEISGALRKNFDSLDLMIAGSIADTPIELQEPLNVLFAENDISISPFQLLLGEGKLEGSFNKKANKIELDLIADNADLSPTLLLLPEIPITGLLSGKFNVSAENSTMQGMFNFNLTNMKSTNAASPISQNLIITTSGKINSNTTDITGTIELPELTTANFSATLPLQIDTSTLKLDFVDERPANGTLTWNGEIRPVWAITNMIDHDLSGNLDATFNFSGNLINPDIDGRLKLINGRYENMQTGFVAADIDMETTIVDRQFTLDRLSANDGEQGTITAKGNVNIAEDFSYSAKANLELSKARIIRQPELNIIASSNLTFEKTNTLPKLSGEITVENADIGSVTQGGPTITTLNVREINSDGVEIENNNEETKVEPIDLDLKFIVPGKLFIRSYGLDSEWAADLTITGTSEKPIVDGTASLIRGFFEFSGKRFNLTRGSLDFPNDVSNDPAIDINAEHSLSDLVANLHIFGKASAPKLEITSTPYLPENEVLSRILFGTSVAELTAVEAVQLATAVHSLSNGGGEGFMGGVRRAIGVDRLSIDNDSSREYGTTITGGKYLTDNVYVEVSTAPATGETATSVEVGLTRNLSLVTRRTLDHDNNLSIRWFWNY